ncbi:MAG: 4Fe-4S dicluster domain-containing protein [Bacteroidetes bacterium]|nr:4Fe-4S dicluster domain-containing protein [Bacteroidota bacterium]
MEKQNRRSFLKTTALIGAAATGISTKSASAKPKNILSEDRMGVLVDTTVCIGCRNCEWACKTAHNIPTEDQIKYEDRSVFKQMRRPEPNAFTVVNEYPNPQNSALPTDVKIQCMHCDHPACVSACIVGAISKEENGSVIWDTKKCIGCRYCMVACPFQIPSFDYNKPMNPEIRKCDFCIERTKKGLLPACVKNCPVEALTYGPRNELIKEARERIKRYPDKYFNHIYGETEAGGTSWMYLANQDFSKLAFPSPGDKPMPGASESIQHGIFAYFVPPAFLYALLGGIMWITKKRNEPE